MASFVPPALSPTPAPRPPRTGGAARRWQQRASPLARYAFVAYVLIVIDASLFPFDGWRDLGIGPFDYLSAPWPRNILPFDLAVNALGYLPLGLFAGLAMHPRVRGVAALVVATLVCAALSIALEGVQTYLPARVASTIDVLSNTAGGIVGAAIAMRFAHPLLDTGRLRIWRARWFAPDVSRGLVLMIVWFGALVYPDAFVFGTGGLLKAFDPDAALHLADLAGFTNDADAVSTAYRFQLAEMAITAMTIGGVGLMFLALFRSSVRWAFRLALLATFVFVTIGVEVLAHAFLFPDASPWPVLTQGARSGVACAALALFVLSPMPAAWRWALALAALVGAVALVNVYPANPYVNVVGLSWTRGRLMNFYGLASGLNLVWPYLAIGYLLRHRARPPARRNRPPGSL